LFPHVSGLLSNKESALLKGHYITQFPDYYVLYVMVVVVVVGTGGVVFQTIAGGWMLKQGHFGCGAPTLYVLTAVEGSLL
jgi:hypothetical protein